jgi:peptidyl-prolyl cis-trans isomerase D
MLDTLRQGASSLVAKVLLGLLVVSFAIWGVAGEFTNYGAATLATVGNEEITVPDYLQESQQYQEMAARTGQQFNQQQVLDQLLLTAALDDEAREHGLGVSDDRLAAEIAKDPRFQSNGVFDRTRFLFALENSGISRDNYVRSLRRDMVRNQIAASLDSGIAPPQPLVEALYRFQNEERTVSTVTLDKSTIEPVAAPDEKTLAEWFEANTERFRAPEYRKLGLLTLDPGKLADPAAVTAEQVAADYERRKPDLTRPERRHVQQIRFATPEAAQAALEKIEGGADFAGVAAESGTAPSDMDQGMKTRAEIIDSKVAEAAFAAEPNVVVPVLDGTLGPALVRVTSIEPGSVTPLAEAEPRIREDLARRGANERSRALYDQVEDERAGGATLEEIAKNLSLPFRLVDNVAADGTAPDGTPVPDLPAAQQLLSDAFESDVGVENDPVRAGDDDYVFYDVIETTPSRDRALDEVRDKALVAWQEEETANRIAAKAQELLARLQKGETLPDIAAEIGKPVQTFEHVKRGAPPAGLSPNAAAQAFAGPQGHVADAEAATPPDRVLVKVDSVTAPAYFAEAADAKAISEQLAGAMRNDLLQSYNRQLLAERSVRINQAAYGQITGVAP